MAAKIKDVCRAACAGLDSDILDYIVSVIEEFSKGDDPAELKDTISEFLVGAEFSPEAATCACADIFAQLTISGIAPAVATLRYTCIHNISRRLSFLTLLLHLCVFVSRSYSCFARMRS